MHSSAQNFVNRRPRFTASFYALVAAVVLLSADSSQAVPNGARRDSAVISLVDVRQKMLVLTLGSPPAQVAFYWDSVTTFLKDGEFSTPDGLTSGLRVTVEHHIPLGGKHHISKLSWSTTRRASQSRSR